MAAPHFPPPSSDDPETAAAKAALRQAAIAARVGFDPALGEILARHVLASLAFPSGATISGFWPMGEEIDIRPLLAALHARGHSIGLPVTGRRGEALVFRLWTPGAVMTAGRFGTSHPEGPVVTPAVLLIPLLAFDGEGRRLGYGGGFYDRTIAALPGSLRIGCAYAAQEVPLVPTGPFDQKLHAIATEAGVRRFSPSAQ
ncbi:5-formyltetrahydrofolate cyclo-ligase [Acidisoma sp. 7E03]